MVLAVAGVIWASVARDEISFLVDRAPAHWIVYDTPRTTCTHPVVSLDTVFRRTLFLAAVPAEAGLRVRAFRTCTIRVNKQVIPLKTVPDHWKRETSVDVARFLQPGRNEILVTVRNDRGPPALWLVLPYCREKPLVTDSSWEASLAGASWRPAVLASAPRPYAGVDRYRTAERVLPCMAAVWPTWLLYAAVALAVVLLVHRWLSHGGAVGRKWDWIARGTLCVSVALWAILFLRNLPYIPTTAGFDVEGHLQYIDYVQTQRSLPLADQGWEMYHPPLYYALAAILLTCCGVTSKAVTGILAIRLFNLALAVVNLCATFGCLRLLFPSQPRRQAIGLVFVAFLPVQLYMYQYPTNEIMAGTLATVASYVLLRILCIPGAGVREYALLGLALGAGLLAKVTILLLIPPVAVALVAKLASESAAVPWRKAFFRLAVVGAVTLSVCGWHYLRTWRHFGTPVISNVDPRTWRPFGTTALCSADPRIGIGGRWWQDPGYQTPGSYLRFGESLDSPLFSFWYSVGDGFYSTMWADSYCGSMALGRRPPWSYPKMVAGLGLSLVLSAGILWGAILAMARYARRPTLPWTFVFALFGTVALFLLCYTLSCPYYTPTKAFYGLIGLLCLSALAAAGLDSLTARSRWLTLAMFVFLGTWGLNALGSFWISPSDVGLQRWKLTSTQGNLADTVLKAERLAAQHPEDTSTRILLCRLYVLANRRGEALRMLASLPKLPDLAVRHQLLAVLAGGGEETLRELRIAMQLDPDDLASACAYVEVLEARHGLLAEVEAIRNVLRINPYSAPHHALLAKAYKRSGQVALARLHEDYASRLRGKVSAGLVSVACDLGFDEDAFQHRCVP
jgi:hypothetical protein